MASGHNSSMSRHMSSTTGRMRRLLETPPGPTESPTGCIIPYFMGILRSFSHAVLPPTAKVWITKSAPGRTSSRSVELSNEISASDSTTRRCASLVVSSNPSGSMSHKATVLPLNAFANTISAMSFLENTTLPAPRMTILLIHHLLPE